jgi:two-component system invasion response regulator UvrY
LHDKVTILLMESHGRLRSELVRRLKSRWPGARVLEADDGETGVALHARHRPAVVVTDVVLPAIGGLDVIAEMKRVQPDVKVIIFSLHSDSQFREWAQQRGALAYVGKQQPLEDILGAIEAALLPAGRP